jgi:Fur family iron response transcriptional regulator
MLTDSQSSALPSSIAADGTAPQRVAVAATAESDFPSRCEDVLRQAGLRLTDQRRMLSQLLFANGDRHVTADELHAAAVEAGMKLSAATVYNTLNQFTELGLLRQIGVGRSKSFYDTNTSVHPHFFFDGEGILCDVPEPGLVLDHAPEPLPGYAIARIDVIVHLRRKSTS